MPLSIDATVGGSQSNSYSTLAELDAFSQTMSPTDAAAWAALATEAAKAPFAARAARLLDTIPFPGTMVSLDQARQWPRFGVTAPVGGTEWGLYGQYYEPTIIPAAVKAAHAQLSVYLAAQSAAGTDPFGGSDAGALSSLEVGPISLSFRESSSSDPATGRDYLQREIYPLLLAGNCVASSRQVRITR